jgi:CheY-like chemotaxis protein
MATKVLFADDQIPWEKEADNDKVLQELIKELGGKLANVPDAYGHDKLWFRELIDSLKAQGLQLILVRTFSEAEQRISQAADYDVAIIDLSWTGDRKVPSHEKKSAGLTLIDKIAAKNEQSGRYTPVIAFSQNYKDQPLLVATVLEKSALPIQKEYTEVGHRTLAAAVKLLAKLRPAASPKSMDDVLIASADRQFEANRSEVRAASILFNRVFVACFILLVALSIGFVLFPAAIPREVFSIIAAAFGLGGGGVLLWAWRRYTNAQASLDAFWKRLIPKGKA